MSNRRKSAGPVPMRQPLLAALDVEYSRAARAKNLERMQDITEIVELLQGLWSTPADAVPVPAVEVTPPTPPAPIPVMSWSAANEEWAPPPPPPAPDPSLPPVPFQLQDLLASVGDEPLWGDQERRQDAKGRIKDVVLRSAQAATGDQMRYELAMQAINKNVTAMELFAPEAGILKTTVADLAARIVAERKMRERRMMHAYAVLARLSAEIDLATGSAIEQLAEAGVQEINALED